MRHNILTQNAFNVRMSLKILPEIVLRTSLCFSNTAQKLYNSLRSSCRFPVIRLDFQVPQISTQPVDIVSTKILSIIALHRIIVFK